MKANKLINIGKSVAVAILILGFIHDIATFTPLIKGGLSCLAPDDLNAINYISLICGTSLVLCGILLIMMLKRMEQYLFMRSPILAIGIFLALNGILSVVYMFSNPFAWIAFVLNLAMFAIIARLYMTTHSGRLN